MSERAVTFELTVPGGAVLQVESFSAVERLSDGFTMRVTAVGAEALDVDAVLGMKASLAVLRGDGHTRHFHGVVLDASVSTPHPDTWRAELTIGARIELAKLGTDCRIFQKKSVPDIVREVLEGVGLTGDAQSWETTASYDPREYVTQFNESDWDFVRRLLDQEGIGFMVRHGEQSETVVFFDDGNAWQPVEGGVSALFDRDATQLSDDVVWSVTERRRGTSDRVTLRDYDFTRPAFDLTVTDAGSGGAREVYDHPGGYRDTGPGRRLAQRRLERLQLTGRVVSVESDSAFLEPGRTVAIAQCTRPAIDGDYVVLACRHEGHTRREGDREVTQHHARAELLAKEVLFRPTFDVPAPMAGALVAFVTTPAGEEIHTEAWGRAKVRFPWDRSGLTDDRSSTWLRVGQWMLSGSMILPRGGYEVLVDVERAELDVPYITGHLYNSDARPPYALPGAATRTSLQSATYQGGPGANELRYEDAAGAEEIFLNASKDLVISVEHDASWRVNNNERVDVGGNHGLRVGGNRQRSVTVNRSVTIDGNETVNVTGVHSTSIGGSESLTIGAMRLGKVGGDLSENTTGTLSRTVGAVQCITGLAGVVRRVSTNLSNTVGGAWVQMSGGSVASSCTGSRTELIGGLKLIKAKTMSVECGAAYTENVATMSVKAGGSRTDDAGGAIAITAGGGLTVKATTINIEAKNRLVVNAGGCIIQLSKSGDVKVRAVSIDLRGAKGINQVTHASN